MSSETEAILYSSNTPRYPGWAGVCSDPDPLCEECGGVGCEACGHSGLRTLLVDVTGDVLPEDVQAILALTPGLPEHTDWAEREELAAAVADAAAIGLADSWWAFAEQPVKMDANGDVWA